MNEKNSKKVHFKKKIKDPEEIEYKKRIRSLMQEELKWQDYFQRIEKTAELIDHPPIALGGGKAGFYFENLTQGVNLLFNLRFKDGFLEFFVIDHDEPVDHGASNYNKDPEGDKRFIKEVLKKFERFD